MSSPTANSGVPTGTNQSGRKLSFGAGNDGRGGAYFSGLEKKRRGSQSQADAAKDMFRKDSIGDAWSNLFK
ncbi:hypothetical protein BCR37DRAFT_394366 [Protomyces lactucae-debilis]|uniref:Uncharacterized protein n=1 Tax=Protomyces lactucae-debilis TaxID=2754530 RepID=A0A1Y2F6B7_PROLT|nr:uncharacterized protein BCR37DRAFT_394366 [Protomyces lactucae-debilis]ORY79024.1 hypothetical protein BCR37DRAFT_394366 [Protomyces lactucae-debilis]